MYPHQSSRIDLGELKVLVVKKLGPEKSKRYFYNLNRFLSQKLSKNEFDKLCFRVLGREHLALHNQLIRSILVNACQAKTPPPICVAGCEKSPIQVEDGRDQSGYHVTNQHQNVSIWPNGVIPKSPKKGRSDRKHRERPSLLGLNGKVECLPNGDGIPCDYQRPIQHIQVQPDDERQCSFGEGRNGAAFDNGEEVELFDHLSFFGSPLVAPLGVPYCSASVGGARKATSRIGTSDGVSYRELGALTGTEMLRKRMEQIAVAQGLGEVSSECANVLNNMLDKYLKQLVRSCMELAGARTAGDLRNNPAQKHQGQSKLINGIWPGNRLHIQSGSGSEYTLLEKKSQRSVSMLDFRVAMELDPKQLGEDWPLLLEKICMQKFEE